MSASVNYDRHRPRRRSLSFSLFFTGTGTDPTTNCAPLPPTTARQRQPSAHPLRRRFIYARFATAAGPVDKTF